MMLTSPAFASPLHIVVSCPDLEEEEAAEVEARLRLEAELEVRSAGLLQLSCGEGTATGFFRERGGMVRRKQRATEGEATKAELLALGIDLLRSRDEAEPPAGDTLHEAPPVAEPDVQAEAEAPEEPAPSPSPWFQSASQSWALDLAFTYEFLGSGSLGALGAEVGGAKYFGSAWALRGFAGGGVGLQVAEELELGVFALGVLLETRPLGWLTVGGGPILSMMRFAGPRGLVSERPTSILGGGQLEVVMAPFGLESGVTVGLRGRLYGRARHVRIEQADVLQVPPWTVSLAIGYRFFAGSSAQGGASSFSAQFLHERKTH